MATAKKTSTSRRAPAKKTSAPDSSDESTTKKASSGTPRKRSAPRAEAPKRRGASQIATEASRQLLELTGKPPEGVSGLRRTDDGWIVEVEVVELRRIPNTTDVLATYEVEVDADGELQSYRRANRYVRGVPGGGS